MTTMETEFKEVPLVPDSNQLQAALPLIMEATGRTPGRATDLLHDIYALMIEAATSPKILETLPPIREEGYLTDEQCRTLQTFLSLSLKHKRHPTYQELTNALGLQWRNSARMRVRTLIKLGFIKKVHKPGQRPRLFVVRAPKNKM